MEIIKIYEGKLVDARELHDFLGNKRQFANWIKQRINECDLIEGEEVFNNFVKNPKDGRPRTEYYLTITAAKEVALMERNDKGKQIRRYFIKCEETLKNIVNSKRLEAFAKLEVTKARLLKNIETIGGGKEDFIQIDYEGRKVFFNGRPLADENLHLVLLKGRDFATELANLIFTEEENVNLERVEQANKNSHDEVRQTIIKNAGKTPESFKSEGDIKKLQQGEDESEED